MALSTIRLSLADNALIIRFLMTFLHDDFCSVNVGLHCNNFVNFK